MVPDITELLYVDTTLPFNAQVREIIPHQTGPSLGTRFPVESVEYVYTHVHFCQWMSFLSCKLSNYTGMHLLLYSQIFVSL